MESIWMCVQAWGNFQKIGYWVSNAHLEASHWFQKQYPGA